MEGHQKRWVADAGRPGAGEIKSSGLDESSLRCLLGILVKISSRQLDRDESGV